MGGQANFDAVPDVAPVWVVIQFFCLESDFGHKGEGLHKIIKCKTRDELVVFFCPHRSEGVIERGKMIIPESDSIVFRMVQGQQYTYFHGDGKEEFVGGGGTEGYLSELFFFLLWDFEPKVVYSYTLEDGDFGHVDEFQEGKKGDYCMDAVFTRSEDPGKISLFLTCNFSEDHILLFFDAVGKVDDLMDRLGWAFFKAPHNAFESAQQAEKGERLQLGIGESTGGELLEFGGHITTGFLDCSLFFEFPHFFQNTLVAFVFQEAGNELFSRVNLIALLIEGFSGQQHFCLNATKGSGNEDKFTGQINIEPFHLVNVSKKVICYRSDWNIVYIQFIAFDKKEEKVKRPLKLGKVDGERLVLGHDTSVNRRARPFFPYN